MNAHDVLSYGHATVLAAIERVPPDQWDIGGVCGAWSSKNVIAHLASFEHVLVDLLTQFVDGDPSTFQNPFTDAFNDDQVMQRAHLSPADTIADYTTAHERTMQVIDDIPPDVVRQPGTLPWYGNEYALDDFIVYTYYGHKREHTAQIAAFVDRAANRR